jgi:hypothetical protein
MLDHVERFALACENKYSELRNDTYSKEADEYFSDSEILFEDSSDDDDAATKEPRKRKLGFDLDSDSDNNPFSLNIFSNSSLTIFLISELL